MANVLRCYRPQAWSAVCHNSQSATLLSDLGLVMYFKYTPCALILNALHLTHSDAPSSLYPNCVF